MSIVQKYVHSSSSSNSISYLSNHYTFSILCEFPDFFVKAFVTCTCLWLYRDCLWIKHCTKCIEMKMPTESTYIKTYIYVNKHVTSTVEHPLRTVTLMLNRMSFQRLLRWPKWMQLCKMFLSVTATVHVTLLWVLTKFLTFTGWFCWHEGTKRG